MELLVVIKKKEQEKVPVSRCMYLRSGTVIDNQGDLKKATSVANSNLVRLATMEKTTRIEESVPRELRRIASSSSDKIKTKVKEYSS